jgi:hypothetical protein
MSANFPFQENIDVFAGEKAEKEYWIKINSKDATSTSPFNFSVKFAMNIATGKNQYLKEAIVEDKYQDIKKIEVSDVIIPRFIPNDILGLVFDGVNLIKMGVRSSYLISTYPGINMRCGVFTSAPNTYPYIKLTNQKDCIILASITGSPILSDDLSSFKYKDLKTIDHITINNIVYPILDISNNNIITLDDYNNNLPDESSLIMANYYSNNIFTTDIGNFTFNNKTVTIAGLPSDALQTMFASNIIRFSDGTTNSYAVVSKYVAIPTGTVITCTFYGDYSAYLTGDVTIQLFGYGSRDMIDERIFYLEMDPFTPVKSSATDSSLNKMFGVLFPSTQSKNWLYCSGEPHEAFLPRDLRKLDKITFTIYDSNGISLNDTFKNRPGFLNPNYFSNMYTTIVLKVEEVDKTLVAKKNELKNIK